MCRNLIISLAGLVLLAGCSPDKTLKDEQIDTEIKSEIRKLDNQVLEGFSKNDLQRVVALYSESFFEKGNRDIGTLVEHFSTKIDPKKFKVLNQFYVRRANPSKDSVIEVNSGTTGEHDYTLSFPHVSTEMFFTVGYFENGLETWAFTTAYGRMNNEWKLNNIELGILRIARKDAIDWYHQAKMNFEHEYLVDAVSALTLTTKCLKPANRHWHYHQENNISIFRGPVQLAIDKLYTFPIRDTAVWSRPEIFEIFPQGRSEGYYPTIYYTTKLNLGDTAALSKECDAMHKGIGQLFKGLDINNEFIIYRAFEFVPAGNEVVRSHEFVKKVPIK